MTQVSNRRQAFAQPQANPATKFLTWRSNDKVFEYYDKNLVSDTNDGKVKVELPFKFLVLDELSSVKGWSDSLTGSIISNEVKFISKEIITAKCYHKNSKGEKVTTEVAKGLYKDIKEKVNSAGGKYHKSIYIMLEGGELANIQLKGACVGKWGEFTQKSKTRLPDEWVIVEKAIDGKKGAVKFTTPEFKFQTSLTEQEMTQADACFDILETYLKAYLVKSEPIPIEEIEVDEENDDLDF
jgi:hypothetical protein